MTDLRAATEADLAHAVRLVAQHWPEPVDEARLRLEWSAPGVVLERDARIGPHVYVLVEDIGERRAWIDIHGSPLEEALEWAEERAASLGAERVWSGAWSTNEPVLRALAERGYVFVRRSARMEISLSEPTAQPEWPPGVTVRTYEPGDERVFYEIQHDAFRDMWEPIDESYEEWAHWHLGPSRLVPDLWFLAEAGSDVCGVAICHPHDTLPDLGWVAILAVRREFRRRGIGRTLLLHALARFREGGFARAALGVDSASLTGANTLYESVGMQVTQDFHIYERSLA